MATVQAVERWDKVIDEILIPMTTTMKLLAPLERFASPKQTPGAIKTATAPLLEAWETDPPPADTSLYEILAPVVVAARA